jgi:aldose sugar dehydrogenase
MRTALWIAVVLAIATRASGQEVFDSSLRVDLYVKGLQSPTGVAFLNNSGDALITQKNDGKVVIVRNRKVVGTALDLPVANDSERGLLSIALSPNFANDQAVYLYHTVANQDGGPSTANRISRYIWNGSTLAFNKIVMDLPGGTRAQS